MNSKFYILKTIILLLLFVTVVQAQNTGSPEKIAFINDDALGDDKGVKKLFDAHHRLGSVDCFPNPCSQETQNRLAQLWIAPILAEITDALNQAEIRNNLKILRLTKYDEAGQILAASGKFDITEQFIEFFNLKDENPKAVFNPVLPEVRVGLVNTSQFYDQQKGIKKLSGANNSELKNGCSNSELCLQIEKAVQSYAISKNINLIFDSSQPLPEEITKYKFQDLTPDFIAEYNKNNP